MINRQPDIVNQLETIKTLLHAKQIKTTGMRFRDRVYGQRKTSNKLRTINMALILLQKVQDAQTSSELRSAMEKLDAFLTKKNTDLHFDPLDKAFGHHFSDFKEPLEKIWKMRNEIISREFGRDNAFEKAQAAFKNRELATSIEKEIQTLQPKSLKEMFAMGHFFNRISVVVSLYEGNLKSHDRKLIRGALNSINNLIKSDKTKDAYIKIQQLQTFLKEKLSKYELYHDSTNNIPFYTTLEKLKQDLEAYEQTQNRTDINDYKSDLALGNIEEKTLTEASQLSFEKRFQKTYDTLESKFFAAITSHHLLAGDVLQAKAAKGMSSDVAALFDNALVAFAVAQGGLFLGTLAEKATGNPLAKAAVVAVIGGAIKEIKGSLVGQDIASGSVMSKNARNVPREMVEIVSTAVSAEFARTFAFQINQANVTDTDSKVINEMVRLGMQSALKNLGNFQDEIKAIKWDDAGSNPLEQFAKIVVRAMRYNPTEFGKFHPVYVGQEVSKKGSGVPFYPYRGGKVELEDFFTKTGYVYADANNELRFFDPPGSNPDMGYIIVTKKDADAMQLDLTCTENTSISDEVKDEYIDIINQANKGRNDLLLQKADSIVKRPHMQTALMQAAVAPPQGMPPPPPVSSPLSSTATLSSRLTAAAPPSPPAPPPAPAISPVVSPAIALARPAVTDTQSSLSSSSAVAMAVPSSASTPSVLDTSSTLPDSSMSFIIAVPASSSPALSGSMSSSSSTSSVLSASSSTSSILTASTSTLTSPSSPVAAAAAPRVDTATNTLPRVDTASSAAIAAVPAPGASYLSGEKTWHADHAKKDIAIKYTAHPYDPATQQSKVTIQDMKGISELRKGNMETLGHRTDQSRENRLEFARELYNTAIAAQKANGVLGPYELKINLTEKYEKLAPYFKALCINDGNIPKITIPTNHDKQVYRPQVEQAVQEMMKKPGMSR